MTKKLPLIQRIGLAIADLHSGNAEEGNNIKHAVLKQESHPSR